VMAMKNAADISIKYTAVLPAKFVAELKDLASRKVIPSVNSGIMDAIEHYIADCKHELYVQQMTEAAKNKGYMKRMLDTQEAFENADSEAGGQW
jgi:hypothetical protein